MKIMYRHCLHVSRDTRDVPTGAICAGWERDYRQNGYVEGMQKNTYNGLFIALEGTSYNTKTMNFSGISFRIIADFFTNGIIGKIETLFNIKSFQK